jgi:hypothetical protein
MPADFKEQVLDADSELTAQLNLNAVREFAIGENCWLIAKE